LESRRVVGVFVARRTWAGEQGVQRRFRAEVREGLDIGNLLPLSSAFAEVIEIPRILGSSMLLSGHFESLPNWYCGQA
jgi:hypothetical protein